ncbi:hypothetical protein ABTZ92_04655, partial [Streptomyces albidoflavus]
MDEVEARIAAAAAEALAPKAAAEAVSGGWRRAGLAGAAIGVVAAGAAAGVAVERMTVGRGMRKRARLALDASGPYGTLRGTPGSAVAEDGTALHYEVDETDAAPAAAAARRRRRVGGAGPPPAPGGVRHGVSRSPGARPEPPAAHPRV